MCELKMLTITSDNMTLCIFFLQRNNKGFHKYDYLEHIYLIQILNSNEFSEAPNASKIYNIGMSLSIANYSLLQCIFIIINLGLNISCEKFTIPNLQQK